MPTTFYLTKPSRFSPSLYDLPVKNHQNFQFWTTPIYNLWLHFKHSHKSPTLTINRVPLVVPLKSTKALILNTPICNLTLQLNSQTTVTAAPTLHSLSLSVGETLHLHPIHSNLQLSLKSSDLYK